MGVYHIREAHTKLDNEKAGTVTTLAQISGGVQRPVYFNLCLLRLLVYAIKSLMASALQARCCTERERELADHAMILHHFAGEGYYRHPE